MSLRTQSKVLRVLQEGEFERLGSAETVKVDVRIIAATNKNLEKEVAEGRFREDLYYRLKVISVQLPPLRARLEDLPALVDYFVARFSTEYAKPLRYVSDQTVRKMQLYHWPGNVRQLENTLRRAVLIAKGDVLLPEHLHFEGEQEATPSASTEAAEPLAELKQRVAELVPEVLRLSGPSARANMIELVEEALIDRALRQCDFNQVHAARLLGISRNTLRHRMQKYGLRGE
jgi:DNA-binding NtrC family response regulator